jgi:hypothetical protein
MFMQTEQRDRRIETPNRRTAGQAETHPPGVRIPAVMAAVSARRHIGLARTSVGHYARIGLMGRGALNRP